jgi:hypothetical protein
MTTAPSSLKQRHGVSALVFMPGQGRGGPDGRPDATENSFQVNAQSKQGFEAVGKDERERG